ncbi:hypothetical protein [Streptomyces sp. NPDC058401]|uniref:hypothetical protein n=1 Tax=Streptomyces sp. NPDC058401 TaxID=3346480 RepID=UPI003646C9CB
MNEGQTAGFRRRALAVLGRLPSGRLLLAAPRTHLARRSASRKIAKFCDTVFTGLDRPIPSDPDSLFAVLRADVERRLNENRGELPFRPVLLYFREFPEGTASGLTASFDDRIVIVVERQTTTLHQFVIFAHEMWHALRGECLTHGARGAHGAQGVRKAQGTHGPHGAYGAHGAHGAHGNATAAATAATAAARSLGGELAGEDLVSLAARSHVDTQEESDAEEFGLQMGTRLRECLQDNGANGAAANSGLADRLQSSMGRGRGY